MLIYRRIALVTLGAWLCAWSAVPLQAQGLNGPTEIAAGSGYRYTHSPSDRYKYITYKMYVPSGAIGIVGFQRVSGTGDNDIRVGTSLSPDSYLRASLGGIAAGDDTTDELPDLLIFADDWLEADWFYAEAYSHDNKAGQWEIRFETFHFVEEAFTAMALTFGQMLLECMLIDCSASNNPTQAQENAGRALNLGVSVLHRTNICSVGVDVATNEAQRELNREFPNNRFIVGSMTLFVGNFFAKVAAVQCPA